MTLIGINCNGLNSKWQSFNKILHDLNPCAFFLQETKLPKKQLFKLNTNEYVIFRLERELSGGGGLALGVIQDLNPILIRLGNDQIEAISVKININKFEVRLVVGYGAQENDRQAKLHAMNQAERKMLLWDFLEVESKEAETLEQGLIIQIDANAHVGPKVVNGDPNPMNPNGKMFVEFLEQNPAIIVVNKLDLCEGLITRRRSTKAGVEESVLDFFMVNQTMAQYLTKMRIDEDEQYLLSNISQRKTSKITTKSDHRTLILDLNLQFTKIKPDAKEFFNFKSKSCQENFKNITDKETNLVECLKTDLPLDEKAKIWLKNLDTVFYKSFKKIKVKNSRKKSDSEENKLLEERRTLIRKAARNPSDLITIRISEIEDKLSKTNFESASSHMTEQLNLAAENDATKGTRSAW